MDVNEARKFIKESMLLDQEENLDAIKAKFNCIEADVNESGDVWISSPQTGHWLNDEKLIELAEWMEAR